MRKLLIFLLKKFNYQLIKLDSDNRMRNYPDFNSDIVDIVAKVKPYTMTSPERIYALVNAVEYIAKNEIKGDIVECGVWKGGSTMAAAYSLLNYRDSNRQLFLYDTFEGMSEPTEVDKHFDGNMAEDLLNSADKIKDQIWCYSTLDEVKVNMEKTKYPASRVRYIKGKVEDTIPANLPGEIAILRLDTDWYESTKHEMEHLFPLLVRGGVLIIDDYGHWQGARKAIDEYLTENSITILLNRIDYTGRIGIKM
ncbi:MAG: TylF/MycF/NovP-related O-methyltransferase [Saprospiraceae bacterium]